MKENKPLYTGKELKQLFQEYNQEFAEKIRKQKVPKTEVEITREIGSFYDALKFSTKPPCLVNRIRKIADYFYYSGIVAISSGMVITSNHDFEKMGLGLVFAGITTGLASIAVKTFYLGR